MTSMRTSRKKYEKVRKKCGRVTSSMMVASAGDGSRDEGQEEGGRAAAAQPATEGLRSRLDYRRFSVPILGVRGASKDCSRVRDSSRNLLEEFEDPSDLLERPTGKNSTGPRGHY